jgi:membrane associated rhomboid family serine protease
LNNAQRLPVATLILIAANIGVAFALVWHPELVGDYGFNSAEPSVKTAFTSMFLHLNVLHLLGNMLFLAAVGPAVETGAGTLRFLTVYLLGGIAGVAMFWAFATKTGSPPPLIGASGCISACVAYYALRYHHLRANLAPNISVPVYWMIGIWLLLQVAGAFITVGSAVAGTAYWAHLGGFAMGLLLSLIFSASRHAHREIAYKKIDEMEHRSPGAKLAAADAVLKSDTSDVNALWEKCNALSLLNEPDEECSCLVKLLDVVPEVEQVEVLSRLDSINRLEQLTSLRRTMLAERLKTKNPDISRLLLLSVIRVMSDTQRPDALFALAALDHEEFPENATVWLRDLFANYPMHPAADVARAKGWNP